MFLIESWFWRGTQSAIFYYASCAPCLDYNYKRKRRKEADRAAQGRPDVVSTQPGAILQPRPFQTNEAWAEEMVAGPGPPKGWKTDKLLKTMKQSVQNRQEKGLTTTHVLPPLLVTKTKTVDAAMPSTGPQHIYDGANEKTSRATAPQVEPGEVYQRGSLRLVDEPPPSTPSSDPTILNDGEIAKSTSPLSASSTSSASTPPPAKSRPVSRRPSVDRKLSNTFDALKGTLRSSLHPERWNWKRYEREDEMLWGFNERINRIWDRATGHTAAEGDDDAKESAHATGRKRAATNDSDRYDYHRARNPEINEMHPPVVSQLPPTREEVAWMMLPPPSRAVMEGKRRPGEETMMRWPLAKIGTTRDEQIASRERKARNARPNEKDARGRVAKRDDEWPPALASKLWTAASMSDGESEPEIGLFDKENIRAARPTSLPLHYESILKRSPAARKRSEQRKSWSDPGSPPLQAVEDGTITPSRWSYSGIWVA